MCYASIEIYRFPSHYVILYCCIYHWRDLPLFMCEMFKIPQSPKLLVRVQNM